MTEGVSSSDHSLEATAARRARAAEIEREMCELAAHTHAAMAGMATLAAELDDIDGWCGDGIRSFASWLTLNAGFSPRSGDELLRVGHALQTLPRISAAFAAGTLSFDNVRELTRVATSEDEQLWLDIAESATGAQLARICRACRRVLDLDTPQHADDQMSRRGVWRHFEDDGMLSLRARLLPEEGALVQAAIEVAMRSAEAEQAAAAQDAVPDPALEPWAARRADALVAMCEHVLATEGTLVSDPTSLPLLVHVDVGVLTGHDPDGQRHLDGGPVLSAATIQRLGCDASVITITERDGLPINVGRRTRVVPRALRRAVQGRDRTCRFPGCAVPSQRTHAHHIEHWAHDGPTARDNLVSLCHFHHRRLHDGAYQVRGTPPDLHFEKPDGTPILRRPPGLDPCRSRTHGLRAALRDGESLQIDAGTARTKYPSARMDLGYVVDTVVDGVQRARLAPPPE